MTSVTPLDLGKRLWRDLRIKPGQDLRYSKLRGRAVLIEVESHEAEPGDKL
jgi:hypothetical protein